MTALLRLQGESLSQRASKAIRQAIFQGVLTPGAPLRELSLSRELGTSQAVIREALLRLENEGLVERSANRGTRVVNLTGDEVRDRLEVRLLLETEAAHRAARRLDDQGWSALDGLLSDLQDAAAEGDPYRCAQADLALHRAIWGACGNRALIAALEGATVPLFAFASIVRREAGIGALASLHQDLVAALRTARRKTIADALQRHVMPAYGAFLESGAPDLGVLLARP